MSLGPGRRIGAFKPVRRVPMDAGRAEALAATLLAQLAQEPARLTRFLTQSGLEASDLAARAGERDVLVAVLEHVLGDESFLLVVTTSQRMSPLDVQQALDALQTPVETSP
jgi:hypothetical protein